MLNTTRHDRRQRGKCIHCGADPRPGKQLCQVCARRRQAWDAALYRRRQEQGLCGLCGKAPQDPGYVRCAPCREKAAGRRRAGWCIDCANAARPGRTRCQTCATRACELDAARYRDRKARGLCGLCGKAPPAAGHVLCAVCLLRKPVKRRTR